MRWKLCGLVLALLLLPMGAGAQETRGNINGTVSDKDGVIPGAIVRITNTDTNQTQQLVTNEKGYFEAVLLISGNYSVRVEMQGYKTLQQTDIRLSVGQTVNLPLKLEVGAISEEVKVTAQAPLLDTSTVSSGQNFDRRMMESMPLLSNMPIMLARFTPGVAPAEVDVQNVFQGYMEGTTNMAGGQVGTGSGFDSRNTGNNYTIDGAQNNGFGRRIASSPNADQIEEVRIETSNFDASQGHGTGVNVSMSTRGGTAILRGSANYTHWNNRLNSANIQQKLNFKNDPRIEDAFKKGREHIGAFTLGGPLKLPKINDGKKTFFFFNYSQSSDSAPGRNTPTAGRTIPTGQAELDGDFSDLLTLPHGRGANTPLTHHQYQIYDPLTARSNGSGGVIRDPFPGNIIPKNRFMNPDGSYKNPAFGIYRAMVPEPNQNFISQGSQPTNNYYGAAEPDQPHNVQGSFRVDYTRSQDSRFFFRGNGNKFEESSLSDWAYASPDPKYVGLMDVSRNRFSWSGTGTWTKVLASKTVIDTQISGNRAHQRDTRKKMATYKPTDIGLPTYMDDYCKARFECILPSQNFGPYPGIGGPVDGGIWVTTYQAQSNLTSTRASHTWRGGVDFQIAQRTNHDGAGNMGSFNYDSNYTRAADTTTIYPAGNLGLSLAAFMLGLPSSISISDNQGFDVRNNYFGTYVQDSWRVNRNLTINLGLRFEWENGIKEVQDRAQLWFDPTAKNAITDAAKAAYAANPDAQGLPVSAFNPIGGSVYAGSPGYPSRTWEPEALLMPRFALTYKMGDRTVFKSGYGMYYDTINARDWTPNQDGYSVTTTSTLSTDFGQTFLLGDPRNGILPLADPFPVLDNGNRYQLAPGNALGINNVLGRGFNAENPNRVHSRVQRWRAGIQRELNSRTAIEIAYSGSYADRQGISIRQDYLPEEYWVGGDTRDTTKDAFLQAQVPNPFYIGTAAAPTPFYASILAADPLLAQRLRGSTTFTAQNIQRQRLLRPFPQMSNLSFLDQPLQVIKAHSLELIFNRRYANGFFGSASFTANRITENRTVEEYDRAPTLWQTNSNGRPWRVVGNLAYELPFGADKPWLRDGVMSKIAGGWRIGGSYEYQPGQLLNWGDIFFHGDINAIKKSNPEIALQADGTVDPTKTWINIDAGFERSSGNGPGAFQKRAFPFKVDGVRGFPLSLVNMSINRTFAFSARRTFGLSVNVQNLLNRQHYNNPTLDPTNTNFGQIRTVNNTLMRFITFDAKFNF